MFAQWLVGVFIIALLWAIQVQAIVLIGVMTAVGSNGIRAGCGALQSLRGSNRRFKAEQEDHEDLVRRLKKQQSDTLVRVQQLEAMLKERWQQ